MESIGDRVVRAGRRAASSTSPGGSRRSATPRTVKRKIVLAGSPPGYEVDRFLILKVLGFASVILWIPLAIAFLSDNTLFAILLVGFAWGVCFFGPDIIARRPHHAAAVRRSSAGCPTRSTCS